MSAMTDLETLLKSQADALAAAVPGFKSVETSRGRFTLEDLKGMNAKLPALRVALLTLHSAETISTGEIEADFGFAAFVIAKDQPGRPREDIAVKFVGGLAQVLPGFRPGAAFWPAKEVRGQNLFSSAIDDAGVIVWGLEFRQTVRMGESAFAGWHEGAPVTEVFIDSTGGAEVPAGDAGGPLLGDDIDPARTPDALGASNAPGDEEAAN